MKQITDQAYNDLKRILPILAKMADGSTATKSLMPEAWRVNTERSSIKKHMKNESKRTTSR